MSTNALAVVGGGSIMPALTVQEAATRYNVMVEFTKTVMVKDQDYGTIPGVPKPCLYKAGAEKLSSLFGLTSAFELVERREDWKGKETDGEPLFYYFYKCKLYRGGELVGEADGSCNSWEKKYRYREGKRKCPKCGGEFIITGKAEYGGGFLCFAKKGGCGAKFRDGDESITKQSVTPIPNPDFAEIINTVQKMAQKRAMVAAVLIACNASAFYTQDAEDMRTIDVEYEPFEGSKENQADYLASKRLEPYDAKKAAIERQKPVPAAVQEWTNIDPEPLAGDPRGPASQNAEVGGVKSIEMRSAARVAEAESVLKDASKPTKRKKGGISFDVLKYFAEVKKLIIETTGTSDAYYLTLKSFGYDHADAIVDNEEGRNIYKQLALLQKRAAEENKLRTELELCKSQHGDRFWAVLGSNGADSIDAVLLMDSEHLETVRKELKAL